MQVPGGVLVVELRTRLLVRQSAQHGSILLLCRQGHGPGRAVPSGSSTRRFGQSRHSPAAWGPSQTLAGCKGGQTTVDSMPPQEHHPTVRADGEAARQPGLLLFWFRPADRSQATAPVPSRSGCRSILGSPPSLLRGQHQQVVGCISIKYVN